MAATAQRTISINVKAGVSDLVQNMGLAKSEVRGFAVTANESLASVEKSTERISRLWRSLFELFLGFEAVQGLTNIAEQANAMSEALALAATTAKNFGNSINVDVARKQLLGLAQSAQGGGFALRDFYSSFQLMVSSGANQAQALRLVADAAGLAAARHLSLAEATNIARYALQGHYAMLTRYGVLTVQEAKNVHNLSDVMKIWERDVAGAAADRAKNLDGAFGRLATSTNLLVQKIGNGLLPIITGMVNAVTAMISAIDKLPQSVVSAVSVLGSLAIIIGAVTLALPAIAKVGAIAAEGFDLLKVAFSGVINMGKGLIAGFGAIIGKAAELVRGLFGVQVAGEAAAGGEVAAAAPIAGIVGAIALVVGALVALIALLSTSNIKWHKFTNDMSKAWGEFVNNVLHSGPALRMFFAALSTMMNPQTTSVGIAEMNGVMGTYVPHLGMAGNDVSGPLTKHLEGLWTNVMSWFRGAVGSFTPPNADLSKFTGAQKAGKGGAATQAAINAAKSVIDAAAEASRQAVDDAKARLDQAKAALQSLQAKGIFSKSDQAAEQSLIADELQREKDLRTAIARQQQAEELAAKRYVELAKALPEADKKRVQQIDALTKAAEQHRLKAIQIKTEWINVGAAVDKLAATLRNMPLEAKRQSARANLDQQLYQNQQAVEANRFTAAVDRIRGTGGSNAFAIEAAKLAVAAAQDRVAFIQHALTIDKEEQNRKQYIKDQQSLRDANLALKKATDDLTLAELTKAQTAQNQQNSFWNALISRIPGLSVKPNDTGGFGGLSLNPWQILLQAVSQSKAFADIMKVVNVIMGVFAQIIDALRPVIDILLQVLLGVVKVFIDLWNAVARILALVGIHIKQLDLENQALQQNVPLIKIYHDLPTLAEIGSGNVAPFQPIDATNNITNPLVNALQDQSLGGGIFGVLGEILGAILALKLATSIFGGGGIFGNILHLFGLGGGGGGIFGASGAGGGAAGGIGSFLTGGGIGSLFAGLAIGGGVGALMKGVMGDSPGNNNAIIGSLLGVGGAALLAGGGSLAGIGLSGALGGLLASGPLGWGLLLGGALLGGAVGGLFGDHTQPATSPDIYNTQAFGQAWANINGAGNNGVAAINANGSSFTESGNVSSALGGEGELQYISQWIAANPQQAAKLLTPQQLQDFTGATTTTLLHNGNWTLNNGVTGNWSDIANAASDAINAIMGSLQQGINGLMPSLTGLATNINSSLDPLNELTDALTLAGATATRTIGGGGHYVPVGPPRGGDPTGPGGGGTGGGRNPNPNPQPPGGGIHLHIQTGDIHGYNDVETLAQDMALTLARAQSNRSYALQG